MKSGFPVMEIPCTHHPRRFCPLANSGRLGDSSNSHFFDQPESDMNFASDLRSRSAAAVLPVVVRVVVVGVVVTHAPPRIG